MAEVEGTQDILQSVEVKFVKTDPKFIEALAIKRNLTVAQTRSMLRYNVFTVNQFCRLSGLSISTVTFKSRPNIVDGKIYFELDPVFPFQDAEREGPKFILRNEKSEKYLAV